MLSYGIVIALVFFGHEIKFFITYSSLVSPLRSPFRNATSAKPVIAPEGSYIPEPPEALEQLAFLWSAPEALE